MVSVLINLQLDFERAKQRKIKGGKPKKQKGGSVEDEEEYIYRYIQDMLDSLIIICLLLLPTTDGGKKPQQKLKEKSVMCNDNKRRNVYTVKGHGNTLFVKVKGALVKKSQIPKRLA